VRSGVTARADTPSPLHVQGQLDPALSKAIA